jgi:hypothetical protein
MVKLIYIISNLNLLYFCFSPCDKKHLLKGQSHEKVYEFFTWDGSFSLNKGSPTLFKILKSPI